MDGHEIGGERGQVRLPYFAFAPAALSRIGFAQATHPMPSPVIG